MINKKVRLIEFSKFDKCTTVYETSRRIPLFKTLISNKCINNCLYCAFRRDRRCERMEFNNEEIVKLTFLLKNKGLIRGVFFSSSVDRDPDATTQKLVSISMELRKKGFSDYIHLRLMPGCSKDLIKTALCLADRVGINVEAPKGVFSEICPDIDLKYDIIKRFQIMFKLKKKLGVKTDIDTQFVVGAGNETDKEILLTTYRLYRKFNLKIIYFSPFEPVRGTPLENRKVCEKKRILRLYQASFLIRDYGIRIRNLLDILENDMLPDEDPKVLIARGMGIFPIDLNNASIKELMFLPGVGKFTAREIVKLREKKRIEKPGDLLSIMSVEKIRKITPFAKFRYAQRKLIEDY